MITPSTRDDLAKTFASLTQQFFAASDVAAMGDIFTREVLPLVPASELIIDVNTYDFSRPALFTWNVNSEWAGRYNDEFHALNPTVARLKELSVRGVPFVKRFEDLCDEPLRDTDFYRLYMQPQGHRYSLIAGQPLQIVGNPVPNVQVLMIRHEERAFSDFEISILVTILPVMAYAVQRVMKNSSAWTHSVLRNAFGLPPRLADVALLVVEGYANKDIAEKLGLTVGTTKHYAHQVFEQTGTATRADLCRIVLA